MLCSSRRLGGGELWLGLGSVEVGSSPPDPDDRVVRPILEFSSRPSLPTKQNYANRPVGPDNVEQVEPDQFLEGRLLDCAPSIQDPNFVITAEGDRTTRVTFDIAVGAELLPLPAPEFQFGIAPRPKTRNPHRFSQRGLPRSRPGHGPREVLETPR